MAYIELVIKIPERIYYGVEKGITVNGSKASQILIDAVKNGTLLPKGHWEHGKELCKEYQGRILVDVTYADWHCSNCNYVIKGTVKPKWNYCPNCGADMRPII